MKNIERIGLGTVQLGLPYGIANNLGQPNESQAFQIIKMAEGIGINLFDTSVAYGNSQELLGESASQSSKLISKWSDDPKVELKNSLKLLNRSTIYGWMAHSADHLLAHPEYWETMVESRANGLVKKIGYSVYYPEQLYQLLDKDMIPELIQLPLNILDQRFMPELKHLKNMNCEVHVRSVFLQGLFFIEPANLHSHFNPIKQWIRVFHEKCINNIQKIAVLLNAVLRIEEVDRLIIGVEKSEQLLDINKALYTEPITVMTLPRVPKKVIIPTYWPI